MDTRERKFFTIPFHNFQTENIKDRRVLRICNQILAESQYRDFLVKKVRTEKDVYKFLERIKKANNRGGDFVYIAFPNKEFWVLCHDRQKEGGDSLEELTNGYSEKTLLSLVRCWADTPEGKRLMCSEGFGLFYKGIRGDGRKK